MLVYWIPRLKSNIVTIGQLDEIGCPTLVKDGSSPGNPAFSGALKQ
jgi:hypothetical protein